MSITLDWTSYHSCNAKIFKLSSDDGNSGSEKCKRDYGGSYGQVWYSLCLVGVWSQAVGFVLVHLVEIWLQPL
jgi:hypothetical protein